jgi:hypothetical protein
MCKRPYMKTPTGVKAGHFLNEKARLAATPFGCGQCLQCKINKSREWKHRIILESMDYSKSIFGTLTYSPKYLPDNGTLVLPHMQNFLKRYRKVTGSFRYYAVGEYGTDNEYKDWKGRRRKGTNRPHYHFVIFGHGQEREKDFDNAWPFGRTEIEELSSGKAGYIVGYTTEKLTKRNNAAEANKRAQFATMSKRDGGIGLKKALEAADAIKQSPAFKQAPYIVTAFQYGKKSFPLGRYLAERVNERLGFKEEDMQELLLARQFELFKEHVFDKADERTIYYDSLLAKDKQKRLNREARFKKYRRKKRI